MSNMIAFAASISISQGVVHQVKPLHSMCPVLVRATAHPPRRIGNVVKDMRQALQSSLEARRSRIEVTLPFGAKLGTEKRESNEGVIFQRTAGDRELARIIAAMFEGTGLKVCVMFATEGERAAAVRMWGPTAKCEIVAWDGKSKTKTGSRSKSTGFVLSKKDKDKQSPKGGFGKSTNLQPQADPDVYIAVGGGAGFLARIRGLGETVGMDKLVILANRNSGNETLPVDLQRYLEEDFEAVYHYKPNPHPNWSGGVLFRKFPDGTSPFTHTSLSYTSEQPICK